MLLVTDVTVLSRVGRDIVHHGQSACRRAVVAMQVFKARSTSKAERRRESCQNGFPHDVVARDGILKDLEITAILDVARNVRGLALNLIARYLHHLVAIPCVLENAVARTNWLVSGNCKYMERAYAIWVSKLTQDEELSVHIRS